MRINDKKTMSDKSMIVYHVYLDYNISPITIYQKTHFVFGPTFLQNQQHLNKYSNRFKNN